MQSAKGQVVFEFVIAALFFIGLVFYVLSTINVSAAGFEQDAIISDLESKAFRLSEGLLKAPGLAYTLASEHGFPLVNQTRLQELKALCVQGDEVNLLTQFDLLNRRYGTYHFYLLVTAGNTPLLECGRKGEFRSATLTRAGVLEGSRQVIKLAVTVW